MSIPTEHDEQKALITWADLQAGKHPELHLLYAIPNGGARSKATAGKLKAEGVRSGVPDLCLPVPRGSFHGLYIEMKRSKRGSTSATQKWWHMALTGLSYQVRICKSFEEAKTVLQEYLALPAKIRLHASLGTGPPPSRGSGSKAASVAKKRTFTPRKLLYPGMP